MKRLVWLLLTVTCWSQVQGNLPRVNQALPQNTIGNPANQIIVNEGVTAGQLIVTCADNNNNSSVAIADSDGNTYTLSSLLALNGSGSSYLQQAWTVAAHTVSSLTITGTPGGSGSGFQPISLTGVGIYDGLTGTTDGTATGTALANTGSISVSPTTTVNGDGIVGCEALDESSGLSHGAAVASTGTQYVVRDNYNDSFQSFLNGGAAGAQTISNSIAAGTAHNVGMIATAFKPTGTITIVTTKMPDGGNGTAYSAKLMAVGGAGAYTWSVSAGSCTGLSITDATNGIYSGTPSVTAGCTVTFQVTDGTTTVTKALTWTIGAALSTPSVTGYAMLSTTGNTSVAVPVNCGDTLLVWLHGSDTHGTTGWLPTFTGTNNYVKDSFGNTPQRALYIAGTGNAASTAYVFGPMAFSGVDSVQFNQNTSSAVALGGVIVRIAGVQSSIGLTSFTNAAPAGSYTVSSSHTTAVPNMLLFELFADDPDGAITVSTDTISFSAPLSVTNSANNVYDNVAFGSALIASASTTSLTTTVTTAMANETASVLHAAFRPAIAANGCPATVYAGEKIRRQIF